jgi:phage shock protein A
MTDPATEKIVKALRELVYAAERKGERTLLCSHDLALAWATQLEKLQSDLESHQREIEEVNQSRDRLATAAAELTEKVGILTDALSTEKKIADAAIEQLKEILIHYQNAVDSHIKDILRRVREGGQAEKGTP